MPKLIELVEVEKKLLLLKQDLFLSLNDTVKIKTFLKEIGEYTSTFFSRCSEYYETIKDLGDAENLLEHYKSRMMSEELDVDLCEVNDFLDKKCPK